MVSNQPEPEWPSGLQCCAACGTDGHGFEPRTSTNACGHVCKYVDRKGLAVMLTPIQLTGVTPEVNLRIMQVRKHTRDPPWLWNPGQTSPAVQNRSISGPTKRTCVLQKLKKTSLKRLQEYYFLLVTCALPLCFVQSVCAFIYLFTSLAIFFQSDIFYSLDVSRWSLAP